MGILLQAATTVLDSTNSIMPAATAPIKELSVLELLTKGGFIMIPLVLFLAIALFFIIERWLFFNQ